MLGIILPDATSLPGNASYVQQEFRYWSNQQAETLPTCRVQPNCPRDVAASLVVAKYFECQFAVKSGGHAAFAGASNIQGGLTIDLANVNQVQVSKDRTLTQVGAGTHWVDVYSQLDPLGLSVVGGRVAAIGVGGLTLGGRYRSHDHIRWKQMLTFFKVAYRSSLAVTVGLATALETTKYIKVRRTSQRTG